MALRRLFVRSAVSPPDTEAPSVPSGTTNSVTATTVVLNISTSTDNRSVSGYELEKDGVLQAGSFPSGLITISGLSPGTSYNFRVRAYDNSGNRSAWSSNISANTSGGGGVKSWNPGHYAFPDHHMYPSKYTSIESDINSLVTPTDKRSKVKGVLLLGTWSMFNPSSGTYDWTKLDYFIDYCKTRGLRSALAIATRRYGGGIPSVPQADYRDAVLPDYVINNGWVGANTDDLGGYSARFDIQACTDAFFTFLSALGAHVDNEPMFEFFQTGETSAAFAAGQGFNLTNWNTQWLRFPAVLASAFPKKFTIVNANYHSSVTETNALVDECITYGVGVGGPDIMPQNLGTTDDHWGFMHLMGVGTRNDPTYGPYPFGTTYLSGKVPQKCEQQVIQDTSFTPATIYNHGYTYYELSHFGWTMHGNPAQTRYGDNVPAMIWETGVWPYLRDNSVPTKSTFPSRLTELGYSAVTGAT